MSSRYQILSTLGWDRTNVKNFNDLTEATNHFQLIREKHKMDQNFQESANGFSSVDIHCELVDNEFEIDYKALKNYEAPKNEKPLVYLASTYTHTDPKVVEERFQKVSKKAAELANQGMIVFSPIAMCHPMAVYGKLPGNWEFWEKFDRAYLSCCNKMIVYKIEGWEKSRGVQAEIKIAEEMKIPIEYINEL